LAEQPLYVAKVWLGLVGTAAASGLFHCGQFFIPSIRATGEQEWMADQT